MKVGSEEEPGRFASPGIDARLRKGTRSTFGTVQQLSNEFG